MSSNGFSSRYVDYKSNLNHSRKKSSNKKSFNRKSFDNNTSSKQSSNGSSKNYKKKEDYIEYRFSNNIGENKTKPFLDIEIPVNKIRKVFEKLSEKYGENNEVIKEYSIYKHNDLELTVFSDGSSFCRQVSLTEVQDPSIPNGIVVVYKEKHKISNDYFPSKYTYGSVVDVVDVIFTAKNGINIVLSTIFENNRKAEKLNSIENLCISRNVRSSDYVWCEIYVTVECTCDVKDVHDTINFVKGIME